MKAAAAGGDPLPWLSPVTYWIFFFFFLFLTRCSLEYERGELDVTVLK